MLEIKAAVKNQAIDIKFSTNSNNFFDVMSSVPFFDFAKISFFKKGLSTPILEEKLACFEFDINSILSNIPAYKFKDYDNYINQCEKNNVLPFSVLESSFYNGRFCAGKLKINYTEDFRLNQKITPFIFKGGQPYHLHFRCSGYRYPNFSQEKIENFWKDLKQQSKDFEYDLYDGFVHISGPFTAGGHNENTNVYLNNKNTLKEFIYHQGINLNSDQEKELSEWVKLFSS